MGIKVGPAPDYVYGYYLGQPVTDWCEWLRLQREYAEQRKYMQAVDLALHTPLTLAESLKALAAQRFINCSSCQGTTPDESRYCIECGKQMPVTGATTRLEE